MKVTLNSILKAERCWTRVGAGSWGWPVQRQGGLKESGGLGKESDSVMHTQETGAEQDRALSALSPFCDVTIL